MNPGDIVTVTSGRGTRQVTVQSDDGEKYFTDISGKQWPKARLREAGYVKPKPIPSDTLITVCPRPPKLPPGHTLPEPGELGLSRIRIDETQDGYRISRNGETEYACNTSVEVVNYLRSIQ